MPYADEALVINHKQVSADMFEIEFITPQIAAESEPGQFLHVRTIKSYDPLLRRPLSLYDVDKKLGSITLLYRVKGRGTEFLTKVKPKEYLDVMGPLGKGFSLPKGSRRVVLVGGGLGIAPLVYLSRRLVEKGCSVQVLYGTESRRKLVAFERFRLIGVDFMPATLDGSAGFKGFVTELLEKKIIPENVDFIYTCGPEPMMAKVMVFARKHGIPGEVSLEEHMACGVGACLGCARKLKADDTDYVKVCKDGPVFSMDQLDL